MFKLSSRRKKKLEFPNRTQVNIDDSNILSTYDKIFVTYANPKYYNIVYCLLKTLNEYTNIPTIFYVVNKYKENIPVPEKFKELNVYIRYVYTDEHIWATKLYVLIDTIIRTKQNTNFIYIDADTLANYTINNLFNYSYMVDNIPYMSLHPTYETSEIVLHNSLPKGKKVDFKKKYAHSDVIWYNNNCINFLREGYNIIKDHHGLGDEIVLNYLQNKYNFYENIHFMTPLYTLLYDYIEKKDIYKLLGTKKNFIDELSLNLFHGLKNINQLNEATEKLIEFNKKNENTQTYYHLSDKPV